MFGLESKPRSSFPSNERSRQDECIRKMNVSVEDSSTFFAREDFRLQTSDFRDIYLNRIAEKVNQYLSGCVPVDEKYGT